MDPVETLMTEHRRIEAGLDVLDEYADRLLAGAEARLDDLDGLVRFIREYADRTHHGKEENILFDVMVREGFPKEGGPIAVMLMEHDEGRNYVRVLAEAVQAGIDPDRQSRTHIASAARSFTGLLRAHIQKEDQILYPMAKARLTAEAYAEVGRRCSEYEALHAQEKLQLSSLVGRLVERYR